MVMVTNTIDCFDCGNLSLNIDPLRPGIYVRVTSDHGYGICTPTSEEIVLSDAAARVLANQFESTEPPNTPTELKEWLQRRDMEETSSHTQ